MIDGLAPDLHWTWEDRLMDRVRFRDWISNIDELTAVLPRHRNQASRQLFEVSPSRRARPVPIAESLSLRGRHQIKPAIRELSLGEPLIWRVFLALAAETALPGCTGRFSAVRKPQMRVFGAKSPPVQPPQGRSRQIPDTLIPCHDRCGRAIIRFEKPGSSASRCTFLSRPRYRTMSYPNTRSRSWSTTAPK